MNIWGRDPDGKPDYAVRNFTYTNNSFGPILQRRFLDLRAVLLLPVFCTGSTVQRCVRGARGLSLRKDSIQQTPVEELHLNWHTPSFTFTPTIAPVLLEIL